MDLELVLTRMQEIKSRAIPRILSRDKFVFSFTIKSVDEKKRMKKK